MFAGEVKNPKVTLQYCNSQRNIPTFRSVLMSIVFLAQYPNCNARHCWIFHDYLPNRYIHCLTDTDASPDPEVSLSSNFP